MVNEQITRPRMKKIPLIERKSLMVGDPIFLYTQWDHATFFESIVASKETDGKFLTVTPPAGVDLCKTNGWRVRSFNLVEWDSINDMGRYVRTKNTKDTSAHSLNVIAMSKSLHEKFQADLVKFKEFDNLRQQVRARILDRRKGKAVSIEGLQKILEIMKTDVVL